MRHEVEDARRDGEAADLDAAYGSLQRQLAKTRLDGRLGTVVLRTLHSVDRQTGGLAGGFLGQVSLSVNALSREALEVIYDRTVQAKQQAREEKERARKSKRRGRKPKGAAEPPEAEIPFEELLERMVGRHLLVPLPRLRETEAGADGEETETYAVHSAVRGYFFDDTPDGDPYPVLTLSGVSSGGYGVDPGRDGEKARRLAPRPRGPRRGCPRRRGPPRRLRFLPRRLQHRAGLHGSEDRGPLDGLFPLRRNRHPGGAARQGDRRRPAVGPPRRDRARGPSKTGGGRSSSASSPGSTTTSAWRSSARGLAADAYAVWEQALDISRMIEEDQVQGGSYQIQVLLNLSHAFLELGRIPSAKEYLAIAERMNRSLGDAGLGGRIQGLQGLIQHLNGNLREATELYKQALETAKELGDIRTQSFFHKYRGDVHLSLGQKDEADADIRAASIFADEGRYPDLSLEAEMSRGRFDAAEGRLADARLHYEIALRAARRIGSRRQEAGGALQPRPPGPGAERQRRRPLPRPAIPQDRQRAPARPAGEPQPGGPGSRHPGRRPAGARGFLPAAGTDPRGRAAVLVPGPGGGHPAARIGREEPRRAPPPGELRTGTNLELIGSGPWKNEAAAASGPPRTAGAAAPRPPRAWRPASWSARAAWSSSSGTARTSPRPGTRPRSTSSSAWTAPAPRTAPPHPPPARTAAEPAAKNAPSVWSSSCGCSKPNWFSSGRGSARAKLLGERGMEAMKAEVKEEIRRARELQATSLELSHNELTELPLELVQLSSLQELGLAHNELTSLPAELARLSSLRQLDVSGNELTALPPEIVRLSGLRRLDLSHNGLTSLPAELGRLSSLRELDLAYNELRSLPAGIAELSGLRDLDLRYNGLTSLPAEIFHLSELQELDLSGNQLRSLPAELCRLSRLQALDLARNGLTSLPTEIAELGNLETLDLTGNQLTALPVGMRKLRNLRKLLLQGNDALNLPPEILGSTESWKNEADPADILEFYFRRR